MSDLFDRITEYVLHGGLYNPELMQHEKVRELLIDCRDEIERLRLTDEEREALSLAYSRLTADSKYDKVTETLRNLLERTK
jgi:hypothetical protein